MWPFFLWQKEIERGRRHGVVRFLHGTWRVIVMVLENLRAAGMNDNVIVPATAV